jgi:hypothetical protein
LSKSLGADAIDLDGSIFHSLSKEKVPAFAQVIGIGLMLKPPPYLATPSLMPWYNVSPWAVDELKREFELTERIDKSMSRFLAWCFLP